MAAPAAAAICPAVTVNVSRQQVVELMEDDEEQVTPQDKPAQVTVPAPIKKEKQQIKASPPAFSMLEPAASAYAKRECAVRKARADLGETLLQVPAEFGVLSNPEPLFGEGQLHLDRQRMLLGTCRHRQQA
jgi:hypothetical protein